MVTVGCLGGAATAVACSRVTASRPSVRIVCAAARAGLTVDAARGDGCGVIMAPAVDADSDGIECIGSATDVADADEVG